MQLTPAHPPARRRWPVRLILVGIVFALLIPGLLFCALLIDRIATADARRSEAAIQAVASRVAGALDRELGSLSGGLVALATSPALDMAELAVFDGQARAVSEALGQQVVLSDVSGQQLVNTRRPFGSPMPRIAAVDTFRRVLADRRPAVSPLFMGATTDAPAIAVFQPVIRGGDLRYVLGMSVQPQHVAGLLARQGLPAGWRATVTDANGRVVARSDGIAPPAVAHPAPLSRPADADPAPPVVATRDGAPALSAEQWLRMADWQVGIEAPLRLLQAPLRGTIAFLGMAGAIALAIAMLLAWRLASLVARPLQHLAAMGRTLGQGKAPLVHSSIAEVHEVGAALLQAHAAAQRFTGSLEREVAARTAELEQANQRLRQAMARGAQTEEQLRQAQKMEAVGQLTGGIAHDFNNLLTIVVGSLDLLRRRATDERQKRLLDNAMEGAGRAATLTARLLAFSRRQPLQPQPLDVNQLVAGMSDLLHRTLGEVVQLETVLAGGLWQTLADPNQLENGLLNLAVNGRDALTAAGQAGGRLVIETANASLAADALDPDLEPGDYVQVSVSDSGHGMPPEVVARVFEPFFTTKPQGQGTGLGLSQVHGFVKQSGGQVRIRTAPDEGTTVTIHLPRFDGHASAQAAQPAQTWADCATDGFVGRTVLVVEDDAGVRRFSVDALRDLGCAVLEAGCGDQALRLIEAHPEIGAMLTDVVLPGLAGPALAAEVLRRRPGLPVLFASGYTGDDRAAGPLPDGALLLEKPFTVKHLAEKLQAVLEAPAAV